MARFSAAQQRVIDAANLAMASGVNSPGPMSAILEEIFAAIAAGSFGITADPLDIDSLAKGGGAFTQDEDTTTGLTFGYKAGRLHNGKTLVTVVAGTIALSASSTNYIEVDRAGTVFKTTVGFTSGRMPLYEVVCGLSSITSVTSRKPLLCLLGPRSTDGSMLSAAAATKVVEIPLGDVTATKAFSLVSPDHAARVVSAQLVVKTAITANDTNYWTFGLANKGPAGSGSTAILAAGDTSTTKATGGSGLTAYVVRSMSLNATDANRNTAANDVLEFTATKTASAADLVQATLKVEWQFDN
jgi:hypothetical protein